LIVLIGCYKDQFHLLIFSIEVGKHGLTESFFNAFEINFTPITTKIMEIDMEKLAQDLKEIRAMNRQWEKKREQSNPSKQSETNKKNSEN